MCSIRCSAAFLALLVSSLGATAQETTSTGAYRLGPRDVIEIGVAEDPGLGGSFTLSDSGSIDLSPLGEIDLAGLSTAEAQERLKQVLEERLLRRASVSLRIREYRSKPINVVGAVNSPGPLSFSGRRTLIEAIIAAGGLSDNHGGTISVLRRADNGLSGQVEVSVDELLVRADPRVNLPIFAGDLVTVPAASPVTIFIIGEFGSQGTVEFAHDEPVTVLSAIAKAGGLTNRASKKIVIKRQSPLGQLELITAEYKAIVAGKAPDLALEDGDVLVAKKSFL